MKIVTVTIDPQGKPTIEGNGFSGKACDKAMKPIEDALLGKDAVRTDKPELFLAASTTTQKTNYLSL